ncbi:MAG: hypothetical protein WC389_16405 [Lutibacter sp.]|jgi:hypothetical protein
MKTVDQFYKDRFPEQRVDPRFQVQGVDWEDIFKATEGYTNDLKKNIEK